MKKTNRTEENDEVVKASLLISMGVLYWIPPLLMVIGAVSISIIFTVFYTVINICFWKCMFKGEPYKFLRGFGIMEFALILPIIIILAVRGLL